MAIMYTFCSCFSVRLGSLIFGIFSMLQYTSCLIASIIWVNTPLETTRSILKPYIEDNNDLRLLFLSKHAQLVYDDPTLHSYLCAGCFTILLASTLGELYGTYHCVRNWLLPFIALELVQLICATSMFIAVMMLVKENSQDLGLLIGATLAGSFASLFLFYCWACVVALFQCLKELGIEGPPQDVKEGEAEDPAQKLFQRARQRRDTLALNLGSFRRYPRYPSYGVPMMYPQPPGYGQLIAPIY